MLGRQVVLYPGAGRLPHTYICAHTLFPTARGKKDNGGKESDANDHDMSDDVPETVPPPGYTAMTATRTTMRTTMTAPRAVNEDGQSPSGGGLTIGEGDGSTMDVDAL